MSDKTLTGAQAARKVAEAHSDLNTFASVVTILEGGHIYMAKSHAAVSQIIKICKAEQGRRLIDYDAAMARVKECAIDE